MTTNNQDNKPDFKDFFKPPYTVDESGCYVWSNDGTQMVFDFYSEEISIEEEQRIRDLIEGREAEPFETIVQNDETISIVFHNHTKTVLSVRGWGYLTGRLRMDEREAIRLQNQTVEYFAKVLKGEIKLSTTTN